MNREQWIAEAMRLADYLHGPSPAEAWSRLRAHLATVPSVPEGWVIVPSLPTVEMVESADNCYTANRATGNAKLKAIYRAMIAAAPKQENQP